MYHLRIHVVLSCDCSILCVVVFFFKQKTAYEMRISDWSSDVCSSDLPAQRTGSPLVPAARHQGRGAPCGESFWHWALGADGGHGHAQPPFRSSRLIGAARQPTSDCRQSLQQSPLIGDARRLVPVADSVRRRSEEHTSELQSLMRISYAVFCLKKKL